VHIGTEVIMEIRHNALKDVMANKRLVENPN
jgi:hypothetical protein